MKVAKKKKNRHPADKLKTSEVIRMTNYLNLSCLINAMWEAKVLDDKELKKEEITKVLTGYKIYLEEVASGRNTVWQAVEDCKWLTGFDVIEIVDEVFGKEKL